MGASVFMAATSWPKCGRRRPGRPTVAAARAASITPTGWVSPPPRRSTRGHQPRVMPVRAGRPYGLGTAEEAVMVQQGSRPASASGAGGSAGRARLSGGVIATLAGGGLLVVFMAQNTENVTLRFLFWSFSWPLWLFTLVVAVLGAVLWIGLGVLRRHRRRVARRDARDG